MLTSACSNSCKISRSCLDECERVRHVMARLTVLTWLGLGLGCGCWRFLCSSTRSVDISSAPVWVRL